MATLNPYKYLKQNLGDKSQDYHWLIVRTYMEALIVVFTRAKWILLKGVFYSFFNKEKKAYAFLDGSWHWGDKMIKVTQTNLLLANEIKIPEKNHMIFVNHVNELDFPFDCFVIKKPYLANQQIKSSYFAYWWMKAMGSEVFDTTHARTISKSVHNLVSGLKMYSYIVYPEGHNSYNEEIKPLKKGMIKVAFENKIPAVVVLKSGITQFQTRQRGNVIGYKLAGTVDPNQFKTWEEMKDYVFKLMTDEKKALDEFVAKNSESSDNSVNDSLSKNA
ncbi:MAG: 1-acyl-sn-glycerol-3-phosphate acyltransferase [Leptospiraceae bacterium]|nr:1-acyl-sn-glycerol-3-phosphate acyltransferase [Leptospiraceae bacterium]